MAKTKACKKCRIFVEGDNCPVCKQQDFTTNWQGRINFLDTKRSRIAQEMGVEVKGEYAIKTR